MSNYIHPFYVDVVIYPCNRINVGLPNVGYKKIPRPVLPYICPNINFEFRSAAIVPGGRYNHRAAIMAFVAQLYASLSERRNDSWKLQIAPWQSTSYHLNSTFLD